MGISSAYQVDGPFEPENGLTFDKDAVLLDPYARSAMGVRDICTSGA